MRQTLYRNQGSLRSGEGKIRIASGKPAGPDTVAARPCRVTERRATWRVLRSLHFERLCEISFAARQQEGAGMGDRKLPYGSAWVQVKILS